MRRCRSWQATAGESGATPSTSRGSVEWCRPVKDVTRSSGAPPPNRSPPAQRLARPRRAVWQGAVRCRAWTRLLPRPHRHHLVARVGPQRPQTLYHGRRPSRSPAERYGQVAAPRCHRPQHWGARPAHAPGQPPPASRPSKQPRPALNDIPVAIQSLLCLLHRHARRCDPRPPVSVPPLAAPPSPIPILPPHPAGSLALPSLT